MNNWSTPSAHDGRRPGPDDTSTQGRNLKREAENFLADTEHSIGGGNLMSTPNHTGGIDLEGAAELWVTPAARDYKGANSELHCTETGGGQEAHGSTEQSSPARMAYPEFKPERTECECDSGERQGSEPNQRAMSRDFGLFPPGPADRDEWRAILAEHPDLAPAIEPKVCGVASGSTGRVDFSRVDQLRSLGNLVVPLQGACALLMLLGRKR